jgi:hypothetical protein
VISTQPEDENFPWLNLYSKVRWRVPIDPTKLFRQQVRDQNHGAQAGRMAQEPRGGAMSPEVVK